MKIPQQKKSVFNLCFICGWKLNRLGMFALACRRERVVEAHREVADEQAAGVGDFKTSRRKSDQSVGGK